MKQLTIKILVTLISTASILLLSADTPDLDYSFWLSKLVGLGLLFLSCLLIKTIVKEESE